MELRSKLVRSANDSFATHGRVGRIASANHCGDRLLKTARRSITERERQTQGQGIGEAASPGPADGCVKQVQGPSVAATLALMERKREHRYVHEFGGDDIEMNDKVTSDND